MDPVRRSTQILSELRALRASASSRFSILTRAAMVSGGGEGGFGGDGSPFCNSGSASVLPPQPRPRPPEFSDVFEPRTAVALVLKRMISS